MKKFAAVSLLVVLAFAAVAANAQMQPKLWIGGGATALMMNGKGGIDIGSGKYDFNLTSSYFDVLVESEETAVGMNWNHLVLQGIKPAAGIRFNEQWGISAAYAIYRKKSSNELYFDTDGVEEITFRMESDWSQNALQLLLQYYPAPHSAGGYLVGGVEMAFLRFDGTESSEHFNGFDTFLTSDTWRIDDSTMGMVLGLGYDIEPLDYFTFFGLMTYSLVKFDYMNLADDDELDVKVGGIAVELGVKLMLGRY